MGKQLKQLGRNGIVHTAHPHDRLAAHKYSSSPFRPPGQSHPSHPSHVACSVFLPPSNSLHLGSKITVSIGQASPPPPGRSSTRVASGSVLSRPQNCHSDRNGVT
eukprot:scaffold27958_cov129-Isochrysis_galbana.AAC.4